MNILSATTRFYNLPTVLSIVGVHRHTIGNWMAKGIFPKCIHVGINNQTAQWVSAEINEWVKNNPSKIKVKKEEGLTKTRTSGDCELKRYDKKRNSWIDFYSNMDKA